MSATRWNRLIGRPATRFAVLSAVALGLAACQVPQPGVHGSKAASAVQSPFGKPITAQPAISQPAVSQAPKPTMLAATPAVAHPADTALSPIAPVSRLSGDPKELVGLDHTVVRRALGDPLRIRSDLPAQVWQYATGDCIVDLYLYNQGGSWTVTYVEARSHTAETAPTARCLKSLLERPTASAE